jgi:hypothetical protein
MNKQIISTMSENQDTLRAHRDRCYVLN